MSDFGDDAYSPYDDLEDILWDADPAPELADELADHAIHSPVYRDEDLVQSEMQDYFSDWEYYSDDYMDDDPALLRNNPQVGTPPKRPVRPKDTVKRGTKRKLAETKDVPPLELSGSEPLTQSIRGTVWATSSAGKTPAYKDGQEKKVALMKDWKEVFGVKDNGWGRSTEQAEDESWAKDMSLGEMGLQGVPRQPSFAEGAQQAGAELEEEDVEEDEGVEEAEDGMDEDAVLTAAELNAPRHGMLEDDEGGGTSELMRAPEQLDDDDEGPRKRRRVKPGLPSPPDSNEAVGADVDESRIMPKMKAAAIPKIDEEIGSTSTTSVADVNTHATNQNSHIKAPISGGLDSRQTKKRKAVEELEELGVAKSTASSRAKRIASTRVNNTQSAPTAPRPTRSSKAT